ncbi:MAG TPA: tetratricopeptide repeat protein [Kiritimatiellae bacterium]|nr:tetratricopeptide repeat protein [Kiritimatiellia bacterium]
MRAPERRRWRRRPALPIGVLVLDWTVLFMIGVGLGGAVLLFGGVPRWSYALSLGLVVFGALIWVLRCFVERPMSSGAGGMRLVGVFSIPLVYAWLRGFFSPVRAEAWHLLVLWGAVVAVLYALSGVLAEGSNRRWRVLLGFFFLLLIAVCLYALVQQIRGERHVLWRLRPATYQMRASGTYICPNHFAHILQIGLCMMLAALITRAAGGWVRIVAMYGIAVVPVCLALTLSRSGGLGMVAGLVVMFALWGWRRNPRWAAAGALSAGVLAIVAAVLILWLVPDARQRWLMAAPSAGDSAVRVRLLLWKDTLAMFRESPVLGIGIGAFRWLYEHYKSHNLQFLFRYTHNEYLQTLAEAGAAGLVAIGSAVCFLTARLLRAVFSSARSRESRLAIGALGAMAASGVHAAFDFNFHIPANVLALAVVVAVPLALDCRTRARESRMAFGGSNLAIGRALVIAVGMCILAVQTVRSGVGYVTTLAGDRLRDSLHLPEARWYYRVAQIANRSDWRPFAGIAHSYKTEAFWAWDEDLRREAGNRALEWYELALARNRYDPGLIIGKAKTLHTLGENSAAITVLRDAVQFAPRDRDLLIELGLLLRFNQRYEEALKVFERALRMAPDSRVAQLNVRLLRRRLGGEAQRMR